VTAPAEVDRVVVLDRFPVTATAPDGTQYRDCRVICTRPSPEAAGWMWVWTDRRPTPELITDTAWHQGSSTLTRDTRQPWLLTTPTGKWRIERGYGCGCGSPLKRMVPWSPMKRAAL
jgi:hypothetical protein